MDTRIALLAAAVLLSARVWADDLPELQEVVVTASRAPTDLLESPSFVTVITQKDIEESGAADVAAAIATQSGVVVNDYGPVGQLKTASIRGSTSSQVLVLVDGVRLNSSFDGWVDLSKLPLDGVDRIEVVRGGASSLWGTGAVGGVINIITKKPDTPSITLAITNGSYLPHDAAAVTSSGTASVPASAASLVDNQRVSLSMSGKLGDVGLTGGGSLTRAANAFVWDDTVSLGGWRQRNNAQDLAQTTYAGATAPLAGGSLSMRGSFDHSLIGVPGSLTFVTSDASQEDTSATGSFAWSTNRFFTDALSFDLKGSYRWAQETYNDPSFPPASVHTTNAAALDLTQKLAISDAVAAIYGASGSYEVVDSTNLSGGNSRLAAAGFASLPVSLLDMLTITPSFRYDWYSDFSGALSFQLGTVLALSDVSALHATVASAYRVPTLSDLYWTDGYTIRDPNLQPETSYSGDVGWSYQGAGISLESALFARLIFNQIEWVFSSTTYLTKVQNITEAFLPGAELHGKVALSDAFALQVDYTFIYSFLLQYPGASYQLSDNQRVPMVPVHDAALSLRYHDPVNTATIEAHYVSDKTFFDLGSNAFATLAGYVVLNAGYRVSVTRNLVFSIALRNILNTVYFTQSGYPMPPFSIVTGMEVKL